VVKTQTVVATVVKITTVVTTAVTTAVKAVVNKVVTRRTFGLGPWWKPTSGGSLQSSITDR